MNVLRSGMGGSGEMNSALAFGGFYPGNQTNSQRSSETYNGTSWANTSNLPSGRRCIEGFGTQNAAVASGGKAWPANVNTSNTYEYTAGPATPGTPDSYIMGSGSISI